MIQQIKDNYNKITEDINRLLTSSVFKVNVQEFNRENLLEQLKQKQQELLKIIQTLEGGVDLSKYVLRPEQLMELERKYQHFDARNLSVDATGNISLVVPRMPIDVEYTGYASTIGNDGVTYCTLPTYKFEVQTLENTLTIKNTTQAVKDKQLIDQITDLTNSWIYQGATSAENNWCKHISTAFKDKIVTRAQNDPNKPYAIQTTTSNYTYSHAHSNSHTQTLGHLCTGSNNFFARIIHEGQLTDVYKMIQFLDGLLYWVQALNNTDNYGTFTAPTRSHTHRNHRAPESMQKFVISLLTETTNKLREILGSEEHKTLTKFISPAPRIHNQLTSTMQDKHMKMGYQENLQQLMDHPEFSALERFIQQQFAFTDNLLNSETLNNHPTNFSDYLVESTFIETTDYTVIRTHNLALANILTYLNSQIKAHPSNITTMFTVIRDVNTTSTSYAYQLLRQYVTAVGILEFLRTLATNWLHYEFLPPHTDTIHKGNLFLNIIQEDTTNFAAEFTDSERNTIENLSYYMHTFRKRINTNKAFHTYLVTKTSLGLRAAQDEELQRYLDALAV